MNTIKLKQSVSLNLNAYDVEGNLGAPLAAAPVWSSSDPSVVAVHVASNGLACAVEAVRVGQARVSVTVPGSPMASELEFQVTPGDAARVEIAIALDPSA